MCAEPLFKTCHTYLILQQEPLEFEFRLLVRNLKDLLSMSRPLTGNTCGLGATKATLQSDGNGDISGPQDHQPPDIGGTG